MQSKGLCILAVFIALLTRPTAGQQLPGAPPIDGDDIGGLVTGAAGPEAGVWVIAETRSLPTRLIRIVVTDDRGRFVIPDLPSASYDVWVRGYGLVDSPKTTARPGVSVMLKAVAAPDKSAAARYYPAQHWFAMMQMPPKSDFPGTGENGNGISPNIHSQGEWIRQVVNTDGCTGCHQMGGAATRTIPAGILDATKHDAKAAWDRRIQAGQAGGGMSARFTQVGRQRAIDMYADWTNRIAAGELPSTAPARPQGRERNVVVTMWDWADPKAYLHDEIASDKRNPTVNPNGPVYGALEESADYFSVVDPKTHTAARFHLLRAIPKHRRPAISRRPPPRPIGVKRPSGTARPRCTVSRWTSRAASGPRPGSARRRRPRGARPGRIIRRQSCSRSDRARAAS
jgi:hypothetical protein